MISESGRKYPVLSLRSYASQSPGKGRRASPVFRRNAPVGGHLFRVAGRQVVLDRRLAGGVPHVFQQTVRVAMGGQPVRSVGVATNVV